MDILSPASQVVRSVGAIYEQRPIAYLEHLVIGSASGCVPGSTDWAQVVQMPVSVLRALVELSSELEHKSIDIIILPFARLWCYRNSEYAEHSWPAPELVRHFINILTAQNIKMKNEKNRVVAPKETSILT